MLCGLFPKNITNNTFCTRRTSPGCYHAPRWQWCDMIGRTRLEQYCLACSVGTLIYNGDTVTWSVGCYWYSTMVWPDRWYLFGTIWCGCYWLLLVVTVTVTVTVGTVLHDGVTWSVWQKKKFRRHFLPHRWLDSASLDCFARNSICFDHFDLHPLIILSTEPPDDQMMQVNMTQDNHQQSTHIDDKKMDEGQSYT